MAGKPVAKGGPGHTASAIQELDVVRLLAEVTLDEGRLPVGTLGTAVFRHQNGEAFEVEFMTPFHALLTLRANEVAALDG
ncbi:MAG: DUF4926 domain-containing protein [Pseudomonadota bacterium]|jgi:hypothetical protein